MRSWTTYHGVYHGFTMNVFREIIPKNLERNACISPVSILTCAVLAFFGSSGETEKEFRQAIRLTDNCHTIAQRMQSFKADVFDRYQNKYDIEIYPANRIFINDRYRLRSSFFDLAERYFAEEVEKISYESPRYVYESIDRWMAKKTKHKISNFMRPRDVTPITSALLVTALYFNAKWKKCFNYHYTKDEMFYGKVQREVPTMIMANEFAYLELPDLDATAVELLYEENSISMVLIKPNKRCGLGELERGLSDDKLRDIIQRLPNSKKEIELHLPKFRVEFDVDLKEPLSNLGMRRAFDMDKAEFKELFESEDHYILKMLHRNIIEIEECSTTGVSVGHFMEARSIEYPKFHFNHPFMFMVIGEKTIYYIGHVVKI